MGKVHASLFSGFGAGDLAAQWMGWDNAFWCEIEDFPRTVLSYWFPNSEKYGNIKETDFTPWRGKIDVLTGGFPCQPFSCAGQRKGQADDRYLWPEMLRAIREIRPTWVIGENVGGILSMVQPGSEITVESQASIFETTDKETLLEQEYVVETVCYDLEQEGYSVQPIVIPACSVGAPHRRDRIFFIAYRSNSGAESLQRERENGVRESEIASNAYRDDARRPGYGKTGCKTRKGQTTEGQRERLRCNAERTCTKRSITYPNGKRCDNRSDHRQERSVYHDQERNAQEDQSERAEWKCRIGEDCSTSPHSTSQQSERMQPEQSEHSQPQQGQPGGECGEDGNEHQRDWQKFPTQSPVCRGNDGLPFDVVRLAIPFNKWREGSVKGYGNAIVPQVMYEIFKAIEESEILE